jgi:glycine oxidase
VTGNSTAAVIGGGIIGSAIAWRLAQRGWNVTLFEKSELGGEASWAGAGMLSPGGEVEERSPFADLCVHSRSLYRAYVEELVRESGVSIDYQECGAIDLAYTPAEWIQLQARASAQRMIGIHSREISLAQLRTFSPYVQTAGLTGALFYPNDGIVNPREVMQALRVACGRHGVQILEHTPVEHVDAQRDGVTLNGRSYHAAIVSAGAWSDRIAVSGAPALPASEPVKGHLIGFDLQLGACPTILRHGHTYLLQRGNGRLIAGSSVEHIGFDRQINNTIVDRLKNSATALLPVLEKLEAADAWTGLRPGAEQLHLGRWHGTSLVLAYGHFRNGILLSPASAERIAAEITAPAGVTAN